MKIRPAMYKDIPAIIALEKDVWWREVSDAADLAAFIRVGYVFVAVDPKKGLVGALIACGTRYYTIEVLDWVVREDFRNLGIGQRLYDQLFQQGKAIYAVIARENAASEAAHRRLGFECQRSLAHPKGHRLWKRVPTVTERMNLQDDITQLCFSQPRQDGEIRDALAELLIRRAAPRDRATLRQLFTSLKLTKPG